MQMLNLSVLGSIPNVLWNMQHLFLRKPFLVFRSESEDWKRVVKKISSKDSLYIFEGNIKSLYNIHIFIGTFSPVVTTVSYDGMAVQWLAESPVSTAWCTCGFDSDPSLISWGMVEAIWQPLPPTYSQINCDLCPLLCIWSERYQLLGCIHPATMRQTNMCSRTLVHDTWLNFKSKPT